MTARFSERASDGVVSLLGNATAGLNVRAAAVNADMGDGYNLPTKWHILQRQKGKRILQLPGAVVSFGRTVIKGNLEYDDNLYDCHGFVRLVMPLDIGRGDPVRSDTIMMRADRLLHEIFTEREQWDGTTLLDADNINDARIVDSRWGEVGPAAKRSLVVEAQIVVTVTETNGPA